VKAIRNIIFDLDGTLIDSSRGVVAAVNYSLRMMGETEQRPEAIKPFIGYSLEKMYPHFTTAPYGELVRHFRVKAAETVVASAVLLPEVESLLAGLCDRGYRMAIATTKVRAHIDGIIEKFGWQSVFQASVGADDVVRVKPDPAAFRLALDRLRAKPEDSLVVGDTVNDVYAAKAIPLRVAAVVSPYGGSDDLAASLPDFLLDSVGKLTEVLDRNGGLKGHS
jgi:HAD superfamily hydrolase (TIGR01509 family)